MKQLADRRRIPAPTYRVVQRVWLSTKNIPIQGGTRKLAPCFVGPFNIIKVISPTAVRLRLPPTTRRVHPTFHVSRLKPVVTHALCPTPVPPPPPRILDGGKLLRSTSSWTATAGAVDCSTWWTGRATALRRGLGLPLGSSWIKTWSETSTRITQFCPLRRQEAPPRGGWGYYNDLYSVCICLFLFIFDILSSCFVCKRSGGFPVFCLVWVSSVCLHVIWAQAQPEHKSLRLHSSVISGFLVDSV